MTISPQYPSAPASDAPADTPADHVNADAPSTDSPHPDTAAPALHRRHSDSADSSTASNDTVTVMVNPEDGLLATKWCPQQVSRTFPRGQEPHRHSRMYPPPPGEQ